MFTHVLRRPDHRNRTLIVTFVVFPLMSVLCVMADGSVAETRVSSAQSGQHIGPLLLKLEQQLAAGKIVLPESDNANNTWLRVVEVAQAATHEIRAALANFASRARDRSITEHAAGREVAAIGFGVFADLSAQLLKKEGGPPTSSETPSASRSTGPPEVPSGLGSPTTGAANLSVPPSFDTASSLNAQPNRANEPPRPGVSAPLGMSSSANALGANATRPLAPSSRPALTETRGPTAPAVVLNSASAEPGGGNTARPAAHTLQTPAPVPTAAASIVALPPIQDQSLAALYATRGDQMLAIKDVSAARRLYEHAANAGSGRAATAVGRTFDPGFLTRLGVVGLKPDRLLAAAWYSKAAALGDRQAKTLLRNLNTETGSKQHQPSAPAAPGNIAAQVLPLRRALTYNARR